MANVHFASAMPHAKCKKDPFQFITRGSLLEEFNLKNAIQMEVVMVVNW